MTITRDRVLVVDPGTEYVDLIRHSRPDRALFLTAPELRRQGREPRPAAEEELLVEMDDFEILLARLREHLKCHGLRVAGVACYDCESMHLASRLAREFDCPYPSPESVLACRCKPRAQELWRDNGLEPPASRCCEAVEAAARFLAELDGRPALLKPLTGSGSELLFACSTPEDCARAVPVMRRRLAAMGKNRMYEPQELDGRQIDPRRAFVVEELITGPEYSCDFIIENGKAEIIRVAQKWLKPDYSPPPAPGIILAYLTPAMPPGLDEAELARRLAAAAQSLGLDHALCMLDFIMEGDRLRPLEIAPRPGGDCLPPLIRAASDFDILGFALDFAAGERPRRLPPAAWQPLAGLRLFADRSGTISRIGADRLRRDSRVLEVKLKRDPGHVVALPPEDYDAWYLGYALFRPRAESTVAEECAELRALLDLEFAA